jgi:hypothetical protein
MSRFIPYVAIWDDSPMMHRAKSLASWTNYLIELKILN